MQPARIEFLFHQTIVYPKKMKHKMFSTKIFLSPNNPYTKQTTHISKDFSTRRLHTIFATFFWMPFVSPRSDGHWQNLSAPEGRTAKIGQAKLGNSHETRTTQTKHKHKNHTTNSFLVYGRVIVFLGLR